MRYWEQRNKFCLYLREDESCVEDAFMLCQKKMRDIVFQDMPVVSVIIITPRLGRYRAKCSYLDVSRCIIVKYFENTWPHACS